MKEWKVIIVKDESKDYQDYYEAKFGWGFFKLFISEAKMFDWINSIKKEYSIKYEPKIKHFKKIKRLTNDKGTKLDLYEEVL